MVRLESLTGLYRIPKHWDDMDYQYSMRVRRPYGLVLTHDQKIPYLDVLRNSWQEIIVRPMDISDQNDRAIKDPYGRRWFEDERDAIETGKRHAQYCRPFYDYAQEFGVGPDRIIVTALNEPNGWAGEPWPLVVAYWCAFLNDVHSYGGRALVGQVGVGQPGTIGGRRETARDYRAATWAPLWRTMDPNCDYFGFHGYYGYAGPWAVWPKDKDPEEHLRWIDETGANLQIPYTGPLIASEAGLDPLIDGEKEGGWTKLDPDLPQAAEKYAAMEAFTDREWLKDRRMRAKLLFTEDYEGPEWKQMNTKQEVWHNQVERFAREGIQVSPWGNDKIDRWQFPIEYYANQQGVGNYAKAIGAVVLLESAGNPWAQNAGTLATGLMQVLPEESPAWQGRSAGRPDAATLFHPGRNLRWGIKILSSGLKARNGDLAWALCLYYGAAGGPDSTAGREYLTAFRNAWRSTWPNEACPVDGGPVVITDPEPFPDGSANVSIAFHAELIAFAERTQLVRLNKIAGLQKVIRSDGFWSTGNEDKVSDGSKYYMAQRAEHPETGEVRVYFCPWGDWGNVHWVRR